MLSLAIFNTVSIQQIIGEAGTMMSWKDWWTKTIHICMDITAWK